MVKSNASTFIVAAQLALVISSVAGMELENRAHGIGDAVVKGLTKQVPKFATEIAGQAVNGAVSGAVNTVLSQQHRRDLNHNVMNERIIALNRRARGGVKASGVKKSGVRTTIAKGVRRHGSNLVSQVVGQAVDGVGQAVNGAVSDAVTGLLTPKQHRRDLDAIKLEPRTHGIQKVIVKGLKRHGSRIASDLAGQAVDGAVQGVVTATTQRQRRDLNNIPVNGARKAHSGQRGGRRSSGRKDSEEFAWSRSGARGYEGLNELD